MREFVNSKMKAKLTPGNKPRPRRQMLRKRGIKRLGGNPGQSRLMTLKDMVSISRPAAMSYAVRGTRANARHVEGPACELLSIVSTSAPDIVAGQMLFSFLAAPALMPQTRLNALSKIYAQYRFTKFWIEYIPAAPTSADGSIALAIDKSVDSQINTPAATSVQSNLFYIMDVDRSVTVPIYSGARLDADCSIPATRQRMFLNDVNSAVDESVQFRVLVCMAVPNSTLTSGFSFLIKVGYEIEFSQPVNQSVLAPTIGPACAYPAGTSISLDATNGFYSQAVIPNFSTAATNNGLLYVVNPQICVGIESGQPCVGAAIVSTKSDGTGVHMVAFRDVETARSQTAGNPGNGSIQGTGVGVILPSQINFIPIGQASLGYHT
jgi:hypothetical protein